MLSSFHNDEVIEKRRRTRKADGGTEVVKKPKMVQEYNQYMGGVDQNDQLIKYYTYSHRLVITISDNLIVHTCRSKKWWRRLFFHFLEMALVNACILFNMKRGRRMPLLDFRISVAKYLLQKHQFRVDRRHVAPTSDLPLRLNERNTFPEKIEKNSEFGGRRLCEVCRARGKKSQTQFCCKTCKTPLHTHPCMELYHTKQDYSK